MLKNNKTQVLRKMSSVQGQAPPTEGVFCSYPHRVCMQNRLDGYEYCVKHILEDKNAPFKQCNYVSNKNGKRCPSVASKADKKDGYCLEHARKAAHVRQRATRKRRPQETPETLLEQIEHYGTKNESINKNREHRRGRPSVESLTNRLLDYASSSDSDSDQMLVDQAWRGDADSDAESVDSEQEDPLKHAGVYTAEEVAQITRDKLIRLQSLYIEQFKRLQHVMKEKRRKYLHTVVYERETLGSVHAAKEDPEQREDYEKLVASKRYHKRYGKEALLHRQSKERRIAATDGALYKPPSYPKCIFSRKGVRCAARTVPLAKYCLQHILHDGHQVLYQSCGYGDGVCKRPVATVMLNKEPPKCPYHPQLKDTHRRFPWVEESMDESKDIDVVGEVEAPVVEVTVTTSTNDIILDTQVKQEPPDKIMEVPENVDAVPGERMEVDEAEHTPNATLPNS